MKLMSIHCSSNSKCGFGEIFAVGAVIYNDTSKDFDPNKVQVFFGMCDMTEPTDPWVAEHVISNIRRTKTRPTYTGLLDQFWDWWQDRRDDAYIVGHIIFPVVTKFFNDLVQQDLEYRAIKRPIPILDVSSMLPVVGENPLLVDLYNKKYNLINPIEGNKFDPLVTAGEILVATHHILRRREAGYERTSG